MLIREISRVVGNYLFFFAIALIVPTVLAAYFEFVVPETHPQPHTTTAFMASVGICLATALLLRWFGREGKGALFRKEALLTVIVIWLISAMMGALPFYLSDTLINPIDSLYEAVSGLSTNGATVMEGKQYDPSTGQEIPIRKIVSGIPFLEYQYYGTIPPVKDPQTGAILYTDIEAVSHALLFWRSMLQWLGGMGIVVLFVAILPLLGVGGKMLYETEVAGVTKDLFAPRAKETAKTVWLIYVCITLAEVLILMLTNTDLSLYDATVISFSTVSTGGFSVKNHSIAAYHSVATESVVMIFMLVGSLNCALYYHCLRGRFFKLADPELIVFLICVVVAVALVAINLVGQTNVALDGEMQILDWKNALRYGSFQLIAAFTTTGFVSVDYDYWPYLSQVLLVITMFIGGMSGSTTGGIKTIRFYLLGRISIHKTEEVLRPESIHTLRIGKVAVDPKIVGVLLCYLFFTLVITLAAICLYAWDNVDLETALSLAVCHINNSGLLFRFAGPTESLAFLPDFSKIISCLVMLFGRLEFFPVVILMLPEFWRKK